jgi:hypothetical protein
MDAGFESKYYVEYRKGGSIIGHSGSNALLLLPVQDKAFPSTHVETRLSTQKTL